MAAALEEAAEVGCFDALELAACCGVCCSCCCGDGSIEEAAEFGCCTCLIELLGCAACCRMCCGCCCPCCFRRKPPAGYAALAPQQAVMGMAAPGAYYPQQQYMGGPTPGYGAPPGYNLPQGYAPPGYAPQAQAGGMGSALAAGLAGAVMGALVEEAAHDRR
mmetsp:Transcript_100854/g.217756  ORF Transcript_100854/g.217756 Transcript_100854/m.217756 type:complete len:162 (+) Transcript_100854:73-558(+)